MRKLVAPLLAALVAFPLGLATTAVSSGEIPNSLDQVGSEDNSPGLLLAAYAVKDNTALAATKTSVLPAGHAILRLDYAAGNGAPPQLFRPQSGTCSSNTYPGTSTAMVSDGGSCVDTTTGDGNSWTVHPGGFLDWREFGVTAAAHDNSAKIQAAIDAGSNLGVPVRFAGVGTFTITKTLYVHQTPIVWASHKTILKRNFAGPALVSTDSPGQTYPVSLAQNLRIVQPTIDNNFMAGAGIILSAVNNWLIDDPYIYSIGPRNTTAPDISGAPQGTFSYVNKSGTGWLPNGGIVLSGGPIGNVENGAIRGGASGNYVWPAANCQAIRGAAGLVMTIPSQDMIGGSGDTPPTTNPPNANVIDGTIFDCNNIGVRNDFASANYYKNLDTTFSYPYGIAIGSFGRYDVWVGGGNGSSSTVGITFMGGPTFNGGGPLVISYTGTGTPAAVASALAGSINGNTTLRAANVTAGVWPHSQTLHIDYGNEFSAAGPAVDAPMNFGLCASNTAPACSGSLILKPFHGSAWEEVSQSASETCPSVPCGGFRDGTARGAVYIGANAGAYIVDNMQQVTAQPALIIHHHAGNGGSSIPNLSNNHARNAIGAGTYIGNGTTVLDPENDIQPYILTGADNISVIPAGTSEAGATIEIVDAQAGASSTFTISRPPSGFGNVTIMGKDSVRFDRTFGRMKLTLYPVNNGTGCGTGCNNSVGDWVGAALR